MRFVDTNVLLYAVSSLANEAGKREVALQLMSEDDLAVSVQVLQEFYYQATRSNRQGRLSHDDAMRFIERLVGMRVQPVTLDVFHEAVSTSHRFGISYWDGAILAAVRAQGCDAVYSEDLSSEQDYDGVQVINPFASVEDST
ncbi:MAG: PIN domain-containing protein [Chloroflexi bacterium]|nr:PIN domain-containing protein [Chloroflexota bacterium]